MGVAVHLQTLVLLIVVFNRLQAPKKKKKKKKKAEETATTGLTETSNYSNDLLEDEEDEDDGPAGRAVQQSDFEKGVSVFSEEDMQKCALSSARRVAFRDASCLACAQYPRRPDRPACVRSTGSTSRTGTD